MRVPLPSPIRLPLLLTLLWGSASAQGAAPPPPPSPSAPAPAATPAYQPPPQPAPLVSAEAIEPGGARVALVLGSEAIVDPSSTFRVVLPGRSEDARLSLVDGTDALVVGSGTREVGQQTILTVAPRQPLTPAARYLLRVDGAGARDLHDAAGRAAGPVELQLVVAGSPPEPVKRKSGGRRRR